MTPELARQIASPFAGRWERHYVAAKIRTDPLYEGVLAELRDSSLPLLDLGCGLGLLTFYLRARGLEMPVSAVDYDASKVQSARAGADFLGFTGLTYECCDLRQGVPPHSGNVTLLDILQFFTPPEQERLLAQAVERVAPGGRLVIRSGLRDGSWRYRLTYAGDVLARVTAWMKAAPTRYPSAAELQRILSPSGRLRISPLWGNTPFNSHLIVLEKD